MRIVRVTAASLSVFDSVLIDGEWRRVFSLERVVGGVKVGYGAESFVMYPADVMVSVRR